MPPKGIRLSTALRPKSTLRPALRDGLAALLARDRRLIAPGERARVGDSIDLDTATAGQLPQANRWDYVLSVPDVHRLVGIEPHSAQDSEISVVVAKKQTAIQYLQTHLLPGHVVARWYWVCHGRVQFSRMDPARRRLDVNGITFVGRTLRSFD